MKKEIYWCEIQKFYENNHTWKEIIEKYKISNDVITKAQKRGLFKSRTKSEANKLSSKNKPKKHTEKTKRKLSKIRKKYLKENPHKVPYLLNHHSKGESYPEKYFNDIFKKHDLNYERELRIKYYSLDFAFVERGINIEIDGEQHYLDNNIKKSNIERDEYLKNIGWETIRIRWSFYKKMTFNEKSEFIEKLIQYLKNKEIIFNVSDYVKETKLFCILCYSEVTKHCKTGVCRNCHNKKRRKIRPPHIELIKEIEKHGYSKTARKYNVSPTTIKRWFKDCNLNSENKCKKCGKEISGRGKKKLCLKCYGINNRRVQRPPYKTLLKEVEESGYSATGRKYGVSDNAIRKWVRFYEKNI